MKTQREFSEEPFSKDPEVLVFPETNDMALW